MNAYADTQPAPLSSLTGDAADDFRVAAPAEVHGLLRTLAADSTMLNIAAADGTSYTTTLWTVDAAKNRVSFSADAGSPQLQRLLDEGTAIVVGYQDAVKLQFRIHGLVLVRGAQACVLQAALPAEMYRFQRRAAFRVRTLPRSAPVARLRHPAIADMRLELRVLDVSIGGCALLLPDDVPGLQPGLRLDGVAIELDADTRFDAAVELHHVTSLSGSGTGVRLGCSLHRLSGDAQRALQRYIDQTQKKRRLMTLD